jgi:hypothetical protein
VFASKQPPLTTGQIAATLKKKRQDDVLGQCPIGQQIPLKAN